MIWKKATIRVVGIGRMTGLETQKVKQEKKYES